MIRQILLSLLLSGSFLAVSAPAYAQTTTQTDQSEEDWRKSKKKTSPDDPWDGFKNTNGWGQGTQRTMSPVDMLPEESRRFLMKERAQRVAEAGIGEPVDTSYEPSDAAKSDPSLESDEKAAWSDMMKDMNGGAGGMPPAGDPNGDPNGQAGGQAGGTPQIPTQVGEIGGSIGGTGTATTSPSVMRGGSQNSVADILSQLKGGGSAPTSAQMQGQQGQAQQGQASTSQAQTGQAPTAAQMQQGQAQAQNSAQSQTQSQSQSQSQDSAQAASQAQADAQSAAKAQAAAQAQSAAAAQANARTPEAISALDRIKRTREERAARGNRSSASDYLKRAD